MNAKKNLINSVDLSLLESLLPLPEGYTRQPLTHENQFFDRSLQQWVKRCVTCDILKPFDEFPKYGSENRKHVPRQNCLVCTEGRSDLTAHTYLHKGVVYRDCSDCSLSQPLIDYPKMRNDKSSYSLRCESCLTKYLKNNKSKYYPLDKTVNNCLHRFCSVCSEFHSIELFEGNSLRKRICQKCSQKTSKLCTICNIQKSIELFNNMSQNGIIYKDSYCSSCRSLRISHYQDGTAYRRCKACKEAFPLHSYPQDSKGRFKLKCRQCSNLKEPFPVTQQCNKCKQEFLTDEFPLTRNGTSRKKTCKDCLTVVKKECNLCHQVKSVEDFIVRDKEAIGLSRYHPYCKQCHNTKKITINGVDYRPCKCCRKLKTMDNFTEYGTRHYLTCDSCRIDNTPKVV